MSQAAESGTEAVVTGAQVEQTAVTQEQTAQAPTTGGSLLDMPPAADSGIGEQATKTEAQTAVPENYTLVIPDLPNGLVVSPEEVTAFTDFAKSSKLSNEQAQSVLDYGIKQNAAAREAMTTMRTQWETSVRADKELGGDNLNATVQTANMAIKEYDTSGTITHILRESGYGSHPDVVRFLYNVGKTLGEDNVPNAGSSGRAETPLEDRLYPTYKVKP